MRVLLINTSDLNGGAAIASSRLLASLRSAGIEADMLVCHKQGNSPYVHTVGTAWLRKLAFVWERLVIWINNLCSRRNLFAVSIANTGFDVTRHPDFRKADIIHLHWINQGMLSLKNIRKILASGKPVVWTLHDMWPCTAICHHAYTCESFKSECSHCHFLRLPGKNDLSRRVFRRKQRVLAPFRLQVVAVSSWLARQVRQSALLCDKPVCVIPNTLSLDDFCLFDKFESRRLLNLPPHRYIILFGAARIDAPIKGFPLLLEAIWMLLARRDFRKEDLMLVMFGYIKHPQEVLPLIPVDYVAMGTVNDKQMLSRLYSAADVTVSASYYETFGQTLIEAQACGCLPVAFGSSGQTDIIRHQQNGYLAEPRSARSLADGIEWALKKGKHICRETLRSEADAAYSAGKVAGQYIHLYQSLIEQSGK